MDPLSFVNISQQELTRLGVLPLATCPGDQKRGAIVSFRTYRYVKLEIELCWYSVHVAVVISQRPQQKTTQQMLGTGYYVTGGWLRPVSASHVRVLSTDKTCRTGTLCLRLHARGPVWGSIGSRTYLPPVNC